MQARGFAVISREKNREISSRGGIAAHQQGRAHEFTPEQAREAGRKGGLTVAQNRAHMAEIGRKGGAKVALDRAHMSEIGKKGGAVIGRNRSHMAEIGRKGGAA